MQVSLHTSKVVKIDKIESWSALETTWNQIYFIPSLPSAGLLFLLYCLLLLSFKAIGKVCPGEVNLFFVLIILVGMRTLWMISFGNSVVVEEVCKRSYGPK